MAIREREVATRRERGVTRRVVGSIRHRSFQHFSSIDGFVFPCLVVSFVSSIKWLFRKWTLAHVHKRRSLDLFLFLVLPILFLLLFVLPLLSLLLVAPSILFLLLVFSLLFSFLSFLPPKKLLKFWKHNILVKAPLFPPTFAFLFHFLNISFLSCMLGRLLFGAIIFLECLY